MGVPGESKQFKAGSTLPKLNDKGLTVFSMRFCPYAERVRLLLNVKHVPYEVVNIDLKSKPEWFLERNPLGKVPAIEEPGKKPLFESLVLAEYLDEQYPGSRQVVPKDAYEKARQKVLIEVLAQKVTVPFYGAFLRNEYDALSAALDDVEKQFLGSKFFAGDNQGYVDLMVWPWFERLPALASLSEGAFDFSSARYPKLVAWSEALLSDPDIKATTYSKELFAQFIKGRDGDAGL
ncbi:putative Pyrimidodiazepine synthase [Hypsibius exemplaris]|uniref:Glutathione S-transferase omega n=1 Tax=Hypsibius exemplaris TaxID=2072580 RepID=A0A1W0XDI3_HYPEX|nr:putative Pyrimidodiazepine synthase [Hypsibius exemplaris]